MWNEVDNLWYSLIEANRTERDSVSASNLLYVNKERKSDQILAPLIYLLLCHSLSMEQEKRQIVLREGLQGHKSQLINLL